MGLRIHRGIAYTAIAETISKTFSEAGIVDDASADQSRPLYALAVLPPSPMIPTDGRQPLTYDAEALIARFNAKGRKLPVDLNHDTTEPGGGKSGGRAVGWIVGLFVGADGGVYAWVDPTAEGIALIDGRIYGYTSPTVRVPAGTTVIAELKSLALTNSPALEMDSNFSAQDVEDDETDEDLTSTEKSAVEPSTAVEATSTPAATVDAPVGGSDTVSAPPAADASVLEDNPAPAPAEATPPAAIDTAAIAAAVEALNRAIAAFSAQTPAPAPAPAADDETLAFAAGARTVADQVTLAGFTFGASEIVAAFQAQAQVETFRAQVESLTTRAEVAEASFATVQKELQETRLQSLLDAACVAGKISPAERPGMEAFARADFEGFTDHLAKRSAHSTTFSLATRGIDEGESFGLTPEQLAHCTRTGVKPETFARELKKKQTTN